MIGLSPRARLDNDLAYARQRAEVCALLAWSGWGLAVMFACFWIKGGCLT